MKNTTFIAYGAETEPSKCSEEKYEKWLSEKGLRRGEYYIECNPRFSGGVEFSCLVGYDCVSNHVRAFENKPIDEFKMLHETFIARKYEEYVTRII